MKLWIQIAIVTAVAAAALVVLAERRGDFTALWLSPDQQGRLAYENKEFSAAADLFEDPEWRGRAAYAAGRYTEAAAAFARIPTAEGFYNRGNAHMKAFEYRPAIAAYKLAVQEAPGWAEARENLELARYTLDYIERSREQSDTGEESGIGADDVVYDNKGERGAETRVTRDSVVEAQSADKWMRSVDTDTADFLRSRFLLEASRRDGS